MRLIHVINIFLRQSKGLSFLVAFVLSGFLFTSCYNDKIHPVAIQGIMDAQQVFSSPKGTSIFLDGEWEFYAHQLLSPEEIAVARPDTFLWVPGFWSDLKKQDAYENLSYGTYRLRVVNHGLTSVGTIRNNEILTAFKLFVNGREFMSNGIVAETKEDATPYYRPGVRSVLVGTDTLELVLQVSNHHHIKDGIFESPQLGSQFALWNKQLANLALSLMFVGSFLMMALYHLGLFIVHKNDRSPLYFSLFLILVTIRMMVTGEESLLLVFPNMSWDMMFRVEYLTFYLAPMFFVLFFKTVFFEEVKAEITRVIVWFSLLFSVLVLFSPPTIYMRTLLMFQLFVFLSASILLYWLWQASKNKRKGALIFFAGGVILFAALVHDFIYADGQFRGMELLPFGLIIFTLCQSYVLALRFSKLNKRNQSLLGKLDFQKKNLEIIVRERTQELLNQKNLLQDINRELEQQKTEVMEQSQAMEEINEMLEKEKEKSDQLLLNVLPKHIADELKMYGKSLSHSYPQVSVLFIDFVGFSIMAESMSPSELIKTLHFYFANFDDVAKKYNLEKIKTIGDAYMCAGGLRENADERDVKSTVMAALEINEFIRAYKEDRMAVGESALECRIGIHTGPVVAGVVGKSKFVFDIWGPTVNIASRMEATCDPGRVNISENTYQFIQNDFSFTSRGVISMKHKKDMHMYFVDSSL